MIIIDKLLTPDEAAEILQITPKTVRQYINQGLLIASKFGNVWRISEIDLQLFIDKQKSKT